MINLTTGPVDIPEEVIEALNSPVISHRSETCKALHQEVIHKLCATLHTREAFVMTGSGTMANDVMLYQIKASGEQGLILTNGEFGERLQKQAERLDIDFITLQQEWGMVFEVPVIAQALAGRDIKWLLLCHCETSTGQLADLETLIALSKKYNFRIYLDCMSTFGTLPVSLKDIAMATASSAKAIGSLSGLALIFSNIKIIENKKSPVYLDLFHLKTCRGIPFTISYNLLAGLNTALAVQSREKTWQRIQKFAALIYQSLKPSGIIPFAHTDTLVFTIVLKRQSAKELGEMLLQHEIRTSFESNYLLQRNWLQVALFSFYETKEIELLLQLMHTFIAGAQP
jgi:aspartate aminotransferase-like enzyme